MFLFVKENLLQVADPEELKLLKSDSAVDGAGRRGGTFSRAYKYVYKSQRIIMCNNIIHLFRYFKGK